jgi:hypothetical protein
MRGVIIRDGTGPGGPGGLQFDLAEVLRALGERVTRSRWRGRGLWYVSRDEEDIETLERLGAGELVAGHELVAILPRLMQVIDGEFEGIAAGGELPWVVVRAVDSSWWEVLSDEPEVLEAIRLSFHAVEELPNAT